MRFLAVNEWRRYAESSHTTWESKSVCSGHGHKLPQSHRCNAARAADPTDKIIAPLIWHIVIIIFHWILCCLHTLTRNVFFQADATLTRTDDYCFHYHSGGIADSFILYMFCVSFVCTYVDFVMSKEKRIPANASTFRIENGTWKCLVVMWRWS